MLYVRTRTLKITLRITVLAPPWTADREDGHDAMSTVFQLKLTVGASEMRLT